MIRRRVYVLQVRGVLDHTQYIKGGLISKGILKFIYSEKATKFCEISTLLLAGTRLNKSKVEILQNFVRPFQNI